MSCKVLTVYHVMSLFTVFLVDCLLITVAHCFPRLSMCSAMKIQTLFFIFSLLVRVLLVGEPGCSFSIRVAVVAAHPSLTDYEVLVMLQTILHLHYHFRVLVTPLDWMIMTAYLTHPSLS